MSPPQPHNTTQPPRSRWASFYLIAALMEELAPLGKDLLVIPPKFWLAVGVYLIGLVTQHNLTAMAIAASVGLVSHDHLSWMLQGLFWTLSQGACLAVRVVTALGVEGYLIIDDVLIPKAFAKLIALCYWDYDHSQKRHSYGQRCPSVKASKDALAPLVVEWQQLSAQAEVVRVKPQGEVQVVSIKDVWHPVRTRLFGLAISENPDLLEFTNL